MRILAICGSLQSSSGNLTLLRSAAALAPAGVEVTLFDGIRHLPHFNPELEPTEAVLGWQRALAESDAVLIACPEYGHSLPGSLKNAIDWVIGTGELNQKPVAITAAVPDEERGRRGLGALRDTLAAVDARVVGGAPIERGPTFERSVAALVEALVAEVSRQQHPPAGPSGA